MSDSPPPPPEPPPLPPPTASAPLPPPDPGLTVPQPPPYMPVPPADSQFASDRKSSHILMYLGIGCGLLALIAVVAVVLGVGWGVRKVTEIGANPEKFTAEMIVRADSNLEVVTSDEAKSEITVRDKTTGEIRTVSYKDASEGKLLIPSSAAASPSASWPGAPAWFPAMEGLVTGTTEGGSTTDARQTLHLTATSTSPTDEIVAFYSDELDKLGFTITRQSQSAGALVNERIEADDVAGARRVTLNVTRPEASSAAGLVVTIETPASP